MDMEKVEAGATMIGETINQCRNPARGSKASDNRIRKALKILGFTKEETEEVIKRSG